MSKHEAKFSTSGPWEIKKDDDQWRIRQKGTVRRIAGGTLERPVGEGFNYKLDAQLAASAPALLEELVIARGLIAEICHARSIPMPEASLKRIDKAISSARGEA